MTFKTIKYDADGSVGVISLNRPERMNAVIEQMYQEIQEALSLAEKDDRIRAIILTGSEFEKNGNIKQAFCAGADLKKHSTGERTPEQKRDYIRLAHETCRILYEFPMPVIAAVNGAARGAGTEMAMNCDFILMAEDATLAFPETGLGTCVGGGVTKHLTNIVGITRAKELIYSGRIIDGKAAVKMGLALNTYPLSDLYAEAKRLADNFSKKAPVSMRLVKTLIHHGLNKDVKSALDNETDAIVECMRTEDWHEGIKAFGEKREPVYKGK